MKWIPTLLLLSVAGNVYLTLHQSPSPQVNFAQRYADLKIQYVSLAESHKNMMELMLTKLDMKKEVDQLFDGAYGDMTDEEFQEKVRRKIVRLEMTIQDLKKE